MGGGMAWGGQSDQYWGHMMMEMLTDPMLRQWVPAWVVEQYERANPFYKEVLGAILEDGVASNRELLRRTRREMVRRHEARQQGRGAGADEAAGGAGGQASDDGSGRGDDDRDSEKAESGEEVEDLVDRLVLRGDEDPNEEARDAVLREARPGEGAESAAAAGEVSEWERRPADERVSAAGPAVQAADVRVGDVAGDEVRGRVRVNPKDFNWLNEACNVSTSERGRLEKLRDEWYGKAKVGDGAEVVERADLDPWQKFAHDIVMDERHSEADPLRLMVTGVAGTGKSRTVRSFVAARRKRVRQFAPRTRLDQDRRGVREIRRGPEEIDEEDEVVVEPVSK